MSSSNGTPLWKEWANFKSPAVYRVNNGTLRIQVQLMSLVVFAGLFALILCIYYSHSSCNSVPAGFGPYESNIYLKSLGKGLMYNSTYPMSPPVHTVQGIQYRIGGCSISFEILLFLVFNIVQTSFPGTVVNALDPGFDFLRWHNFVVVVGFITHPCVENEKS